MASHVNIDLLLCTYSVPSVRLCWSQINKTGATVTIQPVTGSAGNILDADIPVCKAEMDIVDTLLSPSISALPPSAAALVAGRTKTGR